LLVFVLVILLSSCVPASAPATFKIGLVAPFSGRDAALGYNMLAAAKLALKEWNERGGVGGYYIELVAQDDHNEGEAAAVQAWKMALDPQLLGVVGHPSSESARAGASVYLAAHLPAIVLSDARLGAVLGESYVFLLGPYEEALARTASRFAASQGTKRLALLSGSIPPGTGQQVPPGGRMANMVGEEARLYGIEIAYGGVFSYVPGFEKELAEQLKEARPDLIFYGGDYLEGGDLLVSLRANGLNTPVLGGPAMANPDLLKIAGPAAEGIFYLSPDLHPREVAGALGFVEVYRRLAGTDPWPQALLTYDAVNTMLEGLERSYKDGKPPGRQVLGHALASEQFQGLTGPISFGENGLVPEANGYIYRIEGMIWPGRLVK
ncbi:MAG: branched-chain amino acid ABC transporter substrate-binding protein, partial [Dehalococcoidia bacterium]|nr:branched-chain amino acid ABC transporter substrate-binding protein [Dehalococcoidia bacterium]